MNALEGAAGQIFDKLSELIVGPVRGTITTAMASGEVNVPQGQLAQLPDGRRVRVLRATRVTTAPTAVPVRLEHLAPAYPAKGNFVAVAAGLAAVWIAPPTGLPNGTTSAFVMSNRATPLRVGGLAEYTHVDTPAELFAAGVAGDNRLILLSPSLRQVSSEFLSDVGIFDATWKLRWIPTNVGEQGASRALSRNVFDALCGALLGANVAEQPVRFGQWVPMTQPLWKGAWELTLITRLAIEGRITCHADDASDLYAADPPLEGADVQVLIPDDDAQPSPFRVLDAIDTTGP